MRLFFSLLFTLLVGVSGFSIEEKNVHKEDSLKDRNSGTGSDRRVAQGWKLIKRWDFYKKQKDWVIPKDSKRKGDIRLGRGTLEFGNAKSILYYPNKLKVKAKTSYLLIARIRSNNPQGASIGFYNPKTKKMIAKTRIKKGDWHILKALLSIEPISGAKKPKRLYPTIQTQSKDETIEIDWVELWIFPKFSIAAAKKAKRFDLLFVKKKKKIKPLKNHLGIRLGVPLTFGPAGDKSTFLLPYVGFVYGRQLGRKTFYELELGAIIRDSKEVFPDKVEELNIPLSFSLGYHMRLSKNWLFDPRIGLGYMFSYTKFTGFFGTNRTSVSGSIFLRPGFSLSWKASRRVSLLLDVNLIMAQGLKSGFGRIDFFLTPSLGINYHF